MHQNDPVGLLVEYSSRIFVAQRASNIEELLVIAKINDSNRVLWQHRTNLDKKCFLLLRVFLVFMQFYFDRTPDGVWSVCQDFIVGDQVREAGFATA